MLTLLVACGTDENNDDYPELTEPICWTNDGDPVIYKFIPEGVEVNDSFYEMCERLGT
jgi:hypothetical protein